jgi:two-component system phosphate regulon sensor histidine kinase PhoR
VDRRCGRCSDGLVEVLQGAVQMCEKKAADKNVSIQLDCRGDLTALMNGPLLEQAVVNLVDNAIKYSTPL